MIDQLRAIAVVTAVAETGSFRGAGRRLGLSPSVVSHHVSSLEADIGLALFYRTTRRISLTEPGRKLLGHGQRMLLEAEAALAAVQGISSKVRGHLKMTAPAVLQDGPFVADVARFLELYPDVELSIQFSDRRQDVIAGGYDLALRIGAMDNSSLKARRIIGGTQVLCAAPAYLASICMIKSTKDLSDKVMVGITGMPPLALNGPAGKVATLDISRRVHVDTGHAARAFVLHGQGLAVLPRFFVAAELAQGDLVEVLPAWSLPPFDIYAVWPENVGSRSLTKLFVDFLVKELAASPPLKRERRPSRSKRVVTRQTAQGT